MVHQLQNGNEIEAIQAVRSLKPYIMDQHIFKELCYNYIFSEIESVRKECGKILGPKGKLKAHKLYFKGFKH